MMKLALLRLIERLTQRLGYSLVLNFPPDAGMVTMTFADGRRLYDMDRPLGHRLLMLRSGPNS